MTPLKHSAIIRGSVIAAALAALAGCASGPAASSTSATSAAPTAVTVAHTKHLTEVQKLVAEARAAGLPDVYALVRNDKTTYCWRGKNIGTLIPSTKCVYSADQMRQVLKSLAKERHEMMERPQGMCGGKSGCSGN